MSRDPIEEKGGRNLYGFVGNDSVNGRDYLGKAGDVTHGLEKCNSTDTCGELLEKMSKLITSMKERKEEMIPFSEKGQDWRRYVGHAIQIKQQHIMLANCVANFINHVPPCIGTPPSYDPFPLPEWKPECLPWWTCGGKKVDTLINLTGVVSYWAGVTTLTAVTCGTAGCCAAGSTSGGRILLTLKYAY